MGVIGFQFLGLQLRHTDRAERLARKGAGGGGTVDEGAVVVDIEAKHEILRIRAENMVAFRIGQGRELPARSQKRTFRRPDVAAPGAGNHPGAVSLFLRDLAGDDRDGGLLRCARPVDEEGHIHELRIGDGDVVRLDDDQPAGADLGDEGIAQRIDRRLHHHEEIAFIGIAFVKRLGEHLARIAGKRIGADMRVFFALGEVLREVRAGAGQEIDRIGSIERRCPRGACRLIPRCCDREAKVGLGKERGKGEVVGPRSQEARMGDRLFRQIFLRGQKTGERVRGRRPGRRIRFIRVRCAARDEPEGAACRRFGPVICQADR